MKYAMKIDEGAVTACTTMRASQKALLKVCKAINRKEFKEAHDFMKRLTAHEKGIEGKFHDKAAEGVLELLEGLEENAKRRKIEPSDARLHISVHQGPKLMRGRRRRRHGTIMKNTHVQAVLVPAKAKEKVQ